MKELKISTQYSTPRMNCSITVKDDMRIKGQGSQIDIEKSKENKIGRGRESELSLAQGTGLVK